MGGGRAGRAPPRSANENVEIRAATRNPETVHEELKTLEDVKFVKAYIGGEKEDMKVINK